MAGEHQCAGQQIGFVHYEAGRAGERISVEHVDTDVEREFVHAQGIVIGEKTGVRVRRGADEVMLELKKGEAGAAGNGGSGTDGDEHAIDVGDINHGDEPPLREPVITGVGIAGAGAAHRAEKSVRVRAQWPKIAVLVEDLDASVHDHQNLRGADGPHAVRGNVADGVREPRA